MSEAYALPPREWRSSEALQEEEKVSAYTLRKLREFMASKKYFVQRQFTSEENVVFIKTHVESIGENILIYFPSKYNVPQEQGSISATEIIPYELTEKDLLTSQQEDESGNKDNYGELHLDDLKDLDTYSDDNYRAISIESNRDHLIRKKMARYTNQLNKFKNCTAKIPYKFAILTDDMLCLINRYNETESYLVKDGKGLVPNLVESKTDSIYPIGHELYVLIDLPNFYEKIGQIPDDLVRLYKNFYAILGRAHTKQTAAVEHRFKGYQTMIARMMSDYTAKAKFLDLLSSLMETLDKSLRQEKELIAKIAIIEGGRDSTSMTKDTDRSFRLNKNEQELLKTRELKTKTIKLLHEVKAKYHAYIITFDAAVTEMARDLKNIELNMLSLGINPALKKK